MAPAATSRPSTNSHLQSIHDQFGDDIDAYIRGTTPAATPELIATIIDIDGSRATLDETHLDKQPDWTFEPRWSGKMPADRLTHSSVSHETA